MKGWERKIQRAENFTGREREKIKITLTPQHTQSQAGGGKNRLHRPSQT